MDKLIEFFLVVGTAVVGFNFLVSMGANKWQAIAVSIVVCMLHVIAQAMGYYP